jgi:hypothetical protein
LLVGKVVLDTGNADERRDGPVARQAFKTLESEALRKGDGTNARTNREVQSSGGLPLGATFKARFKPHDVLDRSPNGHHIVDELWTGMRSGRTVK